jgi:hypothetical protein
VLVSTHVCVHVYACVCMCACFCAHVFACVCLMCAVCVCVDSGKILIVTLYQETEQEEGKDGR